jgi:hypothetical protein
MKLPVHPRWALSRISPRFAGVLSTDCPPRSEDDRLSGALGALQRRMDKAVSASLPCLTDAGAGRLRSRAGGRSSRPQQQRAPSRARLLLTYGQQARHPAFGELQDASRRVRQPCFRCDAGTHAERRLLEGSRTMPEGDWRAAGAASRTGRTKATDLERSIEGCAPGAGVPASLQAPVGSGADPEQAVDF